MGLKNLNFVGTLIFTLLVHVHGKAIIQESADGEWSSQPALTRRSPGIVVESQGYGGGTNGGGVSSTKMTMNGEPKGNQELDVQSNASGYGDSGMSATSLQFNYGGSGDKMNVESSAHGYGEGDNAVGTSEVSLNTNVEEDVSSASCENDIPGKNNPGNEQQGQEVQLENDAVGLNNGEENVALTDASLKTDNVDVKHTGGASSGPNGAIGLSTNSLHIDDDKEGDINLDTTALGSEGEGGSRIGLEMEDGENGVNDGLTVQSTTEAFGDSDDGVTGSRTVVEVDDEANDRTIDAQSLGVGFSNEYGSGGATEESIRYHDLDEEHHEVENADEYGASRSVTYEVSDVDVQNTSANYNFVSDDGTATSSTTQTRQTSSVVQRQSYYTENSTFQNQDYLIPGQEEQSSEENREYIAQGQDTRSLDQSQNVGLNQDRGYLDSDKQIHTLNQGPDYVIQTNSDDDQTYTASGQQIQSFDQSQNVVIQTDVNEDQSYLVSDQQTQSFDQSQNVVIQTDVNEDQSYLVSDQQTQSFDQSQNVVIQTDLNADQSYLVSDQQIRNLDQNEDSVVQTNLEEDQSYIVSGQQTQIFDQSQYLVSGQQTQNIGQSENYVDQLDETVDESRSYFVSNQQTHSQNYFESAQSQTIDQSDYTLSFQQPVTGTRQIDSPFLKNQPSTVCPGHNQGPGVVCYYQASSIFEYENGYALYPDQVPIYYCDKLVISYAILDFERLQIGAFSQDEERLFSELVRLKNGKLRIILQLQYVAFYEHYINILGCDDKIAKLTSSIVYFLQQRNFDGIELPMMVPLSNNDIYNVAPIIKQGYATLVQRLKTQLYQNNLLLSICLPFETDLINLAYDIPNIIQYVDWFSVNTLDYNVPEQGVLRHSSPLTPESLDNDLCIDYTVSYLINELQVPADKLIINLRLYGTTFILENYKEKTYGAKVSGRGPAGPGSRLDGFLTLSELCSLTQINWLNNPAIVTDYDDVPTLVMKVTYIRSKCLGGVGIHSISMDDPEGRFCGRGPMPFTRAISLAYNPSRDTFAQYNGLELINYIDPATTNKYEV